nr:helicase [Tanacetum cinerariifolium]
MTSTSAHPFNISKLSRADYPRTRASAKTPKRAAFTSVGVPVSYHNLGPPSYVCRSCNAQMWYKERKNKEVAALITNGFRDGIPSRDIVVDNKDEGPKRISELHPSYMALQYPLLFPYREDEYHDKIPYHTNRGTRKTKRSFVSMKEYYAYIIQRNDQGNTLLRGGRLYKQFLVYAFMAVEEQRLKWNRNNQDSLRVDLYHNLNDAFTRGDTNAEGLGKRIVLPKTFTGGPRYMMQNYQDAMALCRSYGYPDLFITFTSNPKWPEIAKMLSFIPGQKPYEHPEVRTQVFKMKLTQLLDDLTKYKIVGKSCAIVYVIEFQKRGLPHAHILFWLKEEWKCQTPSQVDNIISTEMPSPINNPEGYKVVTEFMLHGLCGKGSACTVDCKCLKKYPKSFDPETNLDEDGYPFYCRRDSKIQVVKGKFTYDNKLLRLCEETWELLSQDILLKKRGTGKTFVYKTIISRIRSEGMIVLAVASSGIASLLLPDGRTAHSRFVIPLELVENSTCEIKQNTHLAELLQEVQLIIWDEAPMTQKYAFEALDKTLRDILGYKNKDQKTGFSGELQF